MISDTIIVGLETADEIRFPRQIILWIYHEYYPLVLNIMCMT